MNIRKKIVIIGANSAIAKECARIWSANTSVDFLLVGRNTVELERLALDLHARSPKCAVLVVAANFLDPVQISNFIDGIFTSGSVDITLIAHGFLPDQLICQESLESVNEALQINGVSPLLFAEGFAKNMSKSGKGNLAIISSVAGDRGRKSNYVYGSAKAMINTYVQGLQHRFAASPINISVIKPGPTDTPMTKHLKMQGINLASVDSVAKVIVEGIEKGRPVIYAPQKWRWIMAVIQHMPTFIFNKLNI